MREVDFCLCVLESSEDGAEESKDVQETGKGASLRSESVVMNS